MLHPFLFMLTLFLTEVLLHNTVATTFFNKFISYIECMVQEWWNYQFKANKIVRPQNKRMYWPGFFEKHFFITEPLRFVSYFDTFRLEFTNLKVLQKPRRSLKELEFLQFNENNPYIKNPPTVAEWIKILESRQN